MVSPWESKAVFETKANPLIISVVLVLLLLLALLLPLPPLVFFLLSSALCISLPLLLESVRLIASNTLVPFLRLVVHQMERVLLQ